MIDRTDRLLIATHVVDTISHDDADVESYDVQWNSSKVVLEKTKTLMAGAPFKTTLYDLAESQVEVPAVGGWSQGRILEFVEKLSKTGHIPDSDSMLLILPTEISISFLPPESNSVAAAGGGLLGALVVGMMDAATTDTYEGYVIDGADPDITAASTCTAGMQIAWVNLPAESEDDVITTYAAGLPILFPAETHIESAHWDAYTPSEQEMIRSICQWALEDKIKFALPQMNLAF